jgi:hypothetical protein
VDQSGYVPCSRRVAIGRVGVLDGLDVPRAGPGTCPSRRLFSMAGWRKDRVLPDDAASKVLMAQQGRLAGQWYVPAREKLASPATVPLPHRPG